MFYYRRIYKPSKGTIEEFTDIVSRKKGNVMVVQIGANDGINNDPIHRFIKRDGWRGVLLEPQKFVFEKYLEPLYRKTPGISVLNAALDETDGYKPIYKISVSNSRWATGLTSFNRSVLEESVRSGYVARQARKEGCSMPVNPEESIVEEQVECISTNTLLNRFGIDHVDWLQIDTEGFDYEIIKMFDIARTRPEVIVYENLHLNNQEKQECREFIEKNGYRCRDFGPNTLAALNPGGELLKFFQAE